MPAIRRQQVILQTLEGGVHIPLIREAMAAGDRRWAPARIASTHHATGRPLTSRHEPAGDGVEAPVTIVTGLARSGTSMMMEMLQAGGVPLLTDGVRQGDEDNPRGYFEFEPVKRFPNDLVWLDTAHGRAVKMFYQLFLYGLPDTVRFDVVFMHRDLHEVVASQVRAARNQGVENLDVNEARLVSAFARQVRNVEAWLAAQPAFRVLHLDYAGVLEDSRSASVAIQEFLGRALDVVAMSQVPDPSLYRQRISGRRRRAEGQRRSDRP